MKITSENLKQFRNDFSKVVEEFGKARGLVKQYTVKYEKDTVKNYSYYEIQKAGDQE